MFHPENSKMDSWVSRKEEDSYLGQLEQLLVKRLQSQADRQSRNAMENSPASRLNKLSIEMNEELDRLESMISVEQKKS